MDTGDVSEWLRRYIEVWRSGESARVAELFTEDAVYHPDPFQQPLRGHGDIAAYWDQTGDPPDAFEAAYRPLLVAGEAAVVDGCSRYRALAGAPGPREYRNLFVLRFARDGRCSEYREWFMLDPREPASAAP